MNAVTRILAPAVAAAAVAVPLLVATPATAAPATQDVQFSADGTHWSDSYPGALFGGVLLIPGGSSERPLYVRNAAPDAGVMTVTLFGVTATDTVFAGALSLTASTPGQPGSAVRVTDARPCATLSGGQVLASGDSIRIDTTAALADLTGTQGQHGTASFKLAVTLNSTDAAAPAPDTCPADLDNGGGVVIGTPEPGTGGSAAPVLYRLGSSGWTPVAGTGTGSPTVTPPQTAPTAPGPAIDDLVANTQRLYQEYDVAYWIALAILGALILLVVRRRGAGADPEPLHPISTTRENGTLR